MSSNRLLWSYSIALTLFIVGIGVWQFSNGRETKKDIETLSYNLAVLTSERGLDRIQLDVGKIQFLRNGYSVVLKSIKYEANGVSIQGDAGNPTNLYITNLTLDFRAAQPETFEEFQKARHPLSDLLVFGTRKRISLFSRREIGTAQTSPIPMLLPGTVAPFEVTIPNIKQMPSAEEQPVILVHFSGARYSYAR